MIQIRIGGVPEHFNLPIHLAIEKGYFKEAGLALSWKDYEGGTGQMTQALTEDECDVCILLTEGIFTAILNNNPSKVISGYVKSPLIWGIHSGVHNSIRNHDEIYDKQYAISRIGSGSHLMPIVDGLMHEHKLSEKQFTVINNLQTAINSLHKGETDVFYWEKYTTKPYVERGMLKRIGEFVTPWPCFMIAATDKIIASQPEALARMLKIIHKVCDEFMKDHQAPQLVSERYGIALEDAEYWFHATEWTFDSWVSNKTIESVLFTLRASGILQRTAKVEELVWVRK